MTFRVITDDLKVLNRSNLHPATNSAPNLRLDPLDGESVPAIVKSKNEETKMEQSNQSQNAESPNVHAHMTEEPQPILSVIQSKWSDIEFPRNNTHSYARMPHADSASC